MRRVIAGVLIASVMCAGCSEHFVFRGPPGAPVYVNDTKIGTAPVVYKARPAKPFKYRVGDTDCVSAEGQIGTRTSGGRIVMMVLTAGIVAIFRKATVFQQNALDAPPCEKGPPPPPMPEAIPVPDGSSTIVGQAFLRTRGGDVKLAAGIDIFLCQRDVLYAAVAAELSYKTAAMKGTDLVAAENKLFTAAIQKGQSCRRTIGDAEGRFVFRNVGIGDFLAGTRITWEVPTSNGLRTSGGWAVAEVKITRDGETVDVIATSQ